MYAILRRLLTFCGIPVWIHFYIGVSRTHYAGIDMCMKTLTPTMTFTVGEPAQYILSVSAPWWQSTVYEAECWWLCRDWKFAGQLDAYLESSMVELCCLRCIGALVGVCLAVVIPYFWVSYLRAMQFLCNIVASHRFIIWISIGNDVYPLLSARSNVYGIVFEMSKVMRVALRYCSQVRFVYAGSSSTLQYEQRYSQHSCHMYDNAVTEIIDRVHDAGDVRGITGANLFQGLQLIDRIGHVSPVGAPVVRKGIILFAQWAMVKDPFDGWRRMMGDVLRLYPVKFRSRL